MKARHGTIRRGGIEPDKPLALPDGTRVSFEVTQEQDPLLWLAEQAKLLGDLDLPSDMSEEHDHYIYGTPKRKKRKTK